MILAAIDPALVSTVVAGLLSGGLIVAVAIWRKSGPEAEQIVAATLIEVNEHLRKELALRDEEIERLRKRLNELRRDFDALEAEFHQLSRNRPPGIPQG